MMTLALDDCFTLVMLVREVFPELIHQELLPCLEKTEHEKYHHFFTALVKKFRRPQIQAHNQLLFLQHVTKYFWFYVFNS